MEDLQVLGGDVDVVALGEVQLQAALAGELDVEGGAVEEGQVEADEAAQGDQPADRGRTRRGGRCAARVISRSCGRT